MGARLLVAACVIFLTTAAHSLPLPGASGTVTPPPPAGGDPNLLAVLATMAPGEFRMLDSYSFGASNSTHTSDGIRNDVLPRTLANFDGTPGCVPTTGAGCLTFGSDSNVLNIVLSAPDGSYARTVCDVFNPNAKIACYFRQGGHSSNPDGTVYKFDVLRAADQIRNHATQGHWSILAPSARYIPDVGAPPAWENSGSDPVCINVIGTLIAGNNTITIDQNCGGWISPGMPAGDLGVKIENYSTVQSINGLSVTLTCPSGNCVKASGTATVRFNNSYWPIENADFVNCPVTGCPMPGALHVYFGNVLLDGGATLLLGGEYLWLRPNGSGALDGHPGRKWTINTATGKPTQDITTAWGLGSCPSGPGGGGTFPGTSPIAQAPDGTWYGYCAGGGNNQLYKFASIGASPSILYTSGYADCNGSNNGTPSGEGVIIPDPVNGAGHWAYFIHKCSDANANGGQYLIALDVTNCPGGACQILHGNFATDPNTVFEAPPVFSAYTFDGTHVIGWSGGSAIVEVHGLETVASSAPSVTLVRQNPNPTGNIPNLSAGWTQGPRIYDLGVAYGHPKLAVTQGGDLYLEKP